jgi:hypothetical protein
MESGNSETNEAELVLTFSMKRLVSFYGKKTLPNQLNVMDLRHFALSPMFRAALWA